MAAADFTMKAHDRMPSIQASLQTGGASVDLSTATGVKFIMTPTAGGIPTVNTAAVIVSPASSGVVRYDWAIGDTATPGSYQAEWQVTWAGGQQQTFPTTTYHTISILADLDNA